LRIYSKGETVQKALQINILLALLYFFTYLALIKYSTSSILLLLGILICYVIVATIFNSPRDSFYSPLYWFSIVYIGYSFGAVYYALGNIDRGKFLNLAGFGDDVYIYLEYAALWVIFSYIFFVIGYLTSYKKCEINLDYSQKRIKFYKYICRVAYILIPLLLILGGGYWIFLSYKLAGGPLDLLTKFAAFSHMIKDYEGTTLPYHAYYIGIFLWLFVIVSSGGKIGYSYYAFSFMGLIINLSQGRIMNSITYLLVQVAFYSLTRKLPPKFKKNFYILLLFFFVGFIALFLRISSSMLYIGKDSSYLFVDSMRDTLSLMAQIIIGWGNVSDLQQIAIIFKIWAGKHLYGVTYFDWLINMFGKYVGLEPSSVGLTIKRIYFPDESGPPTPGAIGEAYANFGVFGLIFMFAVGSGLSRLFYHVKRSGNLLLVMCYSMFLMRFVLLYAKVDSTVLVNAIWLIVPFSVIIGIIYLMYRSTCETVY
jgi:hypothetical protein